MSDIVKVEIVKTGPCRFVGGCIYLGNKGKWNNNSLTKHLWEKSGWIFEMLDELKEYATNEIHNAALTTWEKCDEKNGLFGYYIGRFMKAETPVPHDLDYFDINIEYWAKVWVKGKFRDGKNGDLWSCPRYKINQTEYEDYVEMASICAAEAYPKQQVNDESYVVYYRPLKKP